MTTNRQKLHLAFIGILVILLIAFLIVADGIRNHSEEPSSVITVSDIIEANKPQIEPTVFHNGIWYGENPDVDTYLFIGVDKSGEVAPIEGYNRGGQSDVLLLLAVNHGEKAYTVLQLNRDTMAEIDILGVLGDRTGTEIGQLALAHAYGDGLELSCENTVRAISRFLYDTKIDGYFSLQMDAIPILNDWAGGVTVTIEDDFSKIDPSLVFGETITLSGKQAYSFIRSRYYVGEASNLERMKRHRTYLSGLFQQAQLVASENPNAALELYEELEPYRVTDMTGANVNTLAHGLTNYENRGIVTVAGEAKEGEVFMEFYVDEAALKETVLDLFYTEATVS